MGSDEACTGSLSGRIDALLPQTQCTRCGYAGCSPYASAIARGEADINQCPPGGAATIRALAALLGREPKPLNPANGVESPPRVAWIDEERCIGCARCLAPCPVDAIVGAPKYLHTVLAERCTGCELCLPPCPVDCIEMRPGPVPAIDQPARNRDRYLAHVERLERRAQQRRRELEALKASAGARVADTRP
ncbi:MAG TPA: RnfABCDGE type electron transport complex subunit B [Steroidobacteraceae bacterium]|jgi:electron transport complex protein RnfB|nr:RnfABCDGE type electron transport complex subunit B [Steroidobacteraceae bacterium]